MEFMNDRRSSSPAAAGRRAAGAGFLQRVLAGSLILFVLGSVAQRTWVLLNSDLGQILRRLP
jgi:hypothetical protein